MIKSGHTVGMGAGLTKVMVLPVRVFTKICMPAPLTPAGPQKSDLAYDRVPKPPGKITKTYLGLFQSFKSPNELSKIPPSVCRLSPVFKTDAPSD